MTTPPAVLHVVPHASRLGGFERQAWTLATETVRQRRAAGHPARVSLVTTPDDAQTLCNLHRDEPCAPDIRSVPRRRLGLEHRGEDVIGDHDVVHLHGIDGFSAAFAMQACQRGIPLVVKVATEGDISAWAGDPADLLESRLARERPHSHAAERVLRKAYWKRTMRRTWRWVQHASAFVALNRSIESELLRAGIDASRVHVWPNVVRVPETVDAHLTADPARAVTVARLVPRKRIADIIAAHARVLESHPNARLTVVGDGELADALKASSRPEVEWAGSQPVDPSLLSSFGLFVFASEREGCPNALLEAAAVGLPCVSSAIPGVVEIFTDDRDAILFPVGDVDALAKAWTRALATPDLAARLGTAARKTVSETAASEVLIPRYEDLYGSLVARKAGI